MWKSLKYVLPSGRLSESCFKNISLDMFNNFFTSVDKNLTQHFENDILPNINMNRPTCTFDFTSISKFSVYSSFARLPDKRRLDVLQHDNSLLKAAAPGISDYIDIFV